MGSHFQKLEDKNKLNFHSSSKILYKAAHFSTLKSGSSNILASSSTQSRISQLNSNHQILQRLGLWVPLEGATRSHLHHKFMTVMLVNHQWEQGQVRLSDHMYHNPKFNKNANFQLHPESPKSDSLKGELTQLLLQ